MTFLFAQGTEPAGGAAIAEIVIATLGAGIVTAALLILGFGHRSGRIGILGRLAAFSERVSGLPGWAALPTSVATASLLTAVFGMYWDIALHIGVGRDEGPLANPAHYFILVGLFGIFSAGFLAMVLPKEDPSATSVKLGRDWHAPLGGVLICACGAFALIGFPLDDMWHRVFGQDVTLWGPTHLMLIGGASMTLVGIAVLLIEARRSQAAAGGRKAKGWTWVVNGIAGTGGFMLGLSTFQAEFDFGVPQFRFVFQPMLIMLAAGVGLVAIRMWAGRGAALGAVGFFLLVRGFLTVMVGPVLGEPMPHFALYLGEALVVELIALRIAAGERPLAFGLACGAGIGTVGLASEWAWSHVFMPLPWPAELLPEAALLGFAMAMAASLVGAWIGYRLSRTPQPSRRELRTGAVAGAAAIAALVAVSLYKPADEGVRASVALTEVRGAPEREVGARVTLPAAAAEHAEWLTVTAWQGDGLVVDRLRRVRDGVYETTQPIPVHGNWKALVRLHDGNSLTALPIFLPRDEAIPADEVPAPASFERAFVADHRILQREQKPAPGVLSVLGYGVVLAIALSLLALLAWGLHRLGGGGKRSISRPAASRATTPRKPGRAPASSGPAAT